MGVDSAKGVAQAVSHPKATISATKETIKVLIFNVWKKICSFPYVSILFQDKSLDLVFEIARKTFGPIFPMYLLFNFYLKLQLVKKVKNLESECNN